MSFSSACSDFLGLGAQPLDLAQTLHPHLGVRKGTVSEKRGRQEGQRQWSVSLPAPDIVHAAHPFNQTAVSTYSTPGPGDTKVNKMWSLP